MTELLNTLCNGDKARLINVTQEYINNASDEEIMETGYNSNSGYVYIALENGISICQAFNGIEYLVMENGEELFFDTYEEAEEKLNN